MARIRFWRATPTLQGEKGGRRGRMVSRARERVPNRTKLLYHIWTICQVINKCFRGSRIRGAEFPVSSRQASTAAPRLGASARSRHGGHAGLVPKKTPGMQRTHILAGCSVSVGMARHGKSGKTQPQKPRLGHLPRFCGWRERKHLQPYAHVEGKIASDVLQATQPDHSCTTFSPGFCLKCLRLRVATSQPS